MFRSNAHLYPPAKLTTPRSVALRATRSPVGILSTEIFARISSILACSSALGRRTSPRSLHTTCLSDRFLFSTALPVFEALQLRDRARLLEQAAQAQHQPVKSSICHCRPSMWKRKPWRMSMASPKSKQSSRWHKQSAHRSRRWHSQDPSSIAFHGNAQPNDCRYALDWAAPCKAALKPDNLCCFVCAVALTCRATSSGFIHAANVLQMKGLECHGYAMRVNSVVVAIFENITTLAPLNQTVEMISAKKERTKKKRTLQEQLAICLARPNM